ncbi:calcium/sodium antiporter [Candidatus Latescibacterota bacterium]
MLYIMLPYLLLISGLLLLVKGADILVDGASSIAQRLGISELVIGLTVVAFGTSSPELFVNIVASIQGNPNIAIGNIIGSNIANILLILGVSAIIFPLSVSKGTVWKEIPLSLLAAVLLGILANDQLIDKSNFSAVTRIDGLVFLSFFIIFMYYSYGIANRIKGMEEHVLKKQYGIKKSVILIIIGLIGLSGGGKLIVDSAIRIGLTFGINQAFLGLTVVAIGTSLPELATSVVAAFKKNSEIAVGNIVGSNIFNIFFILGISALIKPLPFQPESNIDIGTMIVSSFLLFLCMFTGGKKLLDRWEGIIFILLYVMYITFLIIRL